MDIVIRNIEIEDYYEAALVVVRGWQTAYRGIIDDSYLDSMSVDETVLRWKEKRMDDGFIVAIYEKQVVGIARYAPFTDEMDADCDSELWALYVKPEFKGMGIGKKLINYVMDEFRKLNKKKMIIWCLKDNYPSRGFYEKMGGKLVNYEKDQVRAGKAYKEIGFVYEL